MGGAEDDGAKNMLHLSLKDLLGTLLYESFTFCVDDTMPNRGYIATT